MRTALITIAALTYALAVPVLFVGLWGVMHSGMDLDPCRVCGSGKACGCGEGAA